MVLYPNKLPESERVCSGICKFGFEDMVILIACGLHNFRITHKMSHITI